jgi:lysine 6-dehydrogenase
MRFLVIGSGMMGSAVAFDLARSSGVEQVTLADIDLSRAREVAEKIGSTRVHPIELDVNSFDQVSDVMRGHDCGVAAVSYQHNVHLTKAAIQAGMHLCDLGGNDEVVRKQLELSREAEDAGVAVIPNCGLAPGLANILAARGAEQFESVDSIRLRVGGVPQHPKPPFNYQIVFSVEGLLNEYTGKATVLRNGTLTQLDALTEIEAIDFPSPFGRMEAFLTSGGASLLPEMFAGKVRELDYKTVRYPGHCERFRTLLELGFASNDPVIVGANVYTSRDVFSQLIRNKLDKSGKDVVLLRVCIKGRQGGLRRKLSYELIDFYDENENITAMMRTTAFSTSIVSQLIAGDRVKKRGVATPEMCVPLQPLLEELRDRGINVQESYS